MAVRTDESALESAVLRAATPLLIGLIAAVPLLLLPRPDDRVFDLLIHLIALVAFSFALTWWLAPLGDRLWFPHRHWLVSNRRFITNAALIVIITGVTALVTLASSAAMQYEPSLQLLQLLSALDIAWVVAGTVLAVRLLWGRVAAAAVGSVMSIICVLSIAAYLDQVGLTESGGWLVDSSQMVRLVIPFDVAAALITLGLTWLVARRETSAD